MENKSKQLKSNPTVLLEQLKEFLKQADAEEFSVVWI